MLATSYEVPAALLILGGGLLACFLGYRLFRIVVGVYGFIVGAYIAVAGFGMTEMPWIIAAGVVGGLLGALIFWFAYLFAVALVGAGVGALVADLVFRQLQREPQLWVVILAAVAGAFVAFGLQRLAVIAGTGFGGAWSALVGASLLGRPQAAEGSYLWEAFPTSPVAGERWVLIAWIVLGSIGTMVQLRTTERRR